MASRIKLFGTKNSGNTQLPLDNRVVFYIRASTPEQVNSLDAQKLAGSRWAEAKQLHVTETFVDAGVSAIKHGIRDRPQAKAMFQYMKKHGIRRAIFIRPIRAFRSTLDFCTTTSWMEQEGIVFSFMDPEIDSSTLAGKLMLQLLVSVGEMECETRAAAQGETYDSLRVRRVARGTNAPYGWRIEGESNTRSRKSGDLLGLLVPVPEEQVVLREMTRLYERHKGNHGTLTIIATHLNNNRIPTKTPAGTVMTRVLHRGTPRERTVHITTDGKWKAANVKSVLAHADLATDAELPNGLPAFEQVGNLD